MATAINIVIWQLLPLLAGYSLYVRPHSLIKNTDLATETSMCMNIYTFVVTIS